MDKKTIEFNKNLRSNKKIDFKAGDVVEVYLKIKEGGKERVQIFKGLVLAVKGKQSSSPTLTVRKVSHEVGVEMIIPILSKNVEKIKLIKQAKVRRAKLYYIRELTTKQSRMKYKEIKEFIKEEDTQKNTEVKQNDTEDKEEIKKEEKK
ncbi:MAG: 50S ribosomal protein L19 [Candidatus Moranbacteria bacterium RIFOXYA12_FULL_35_19]|nr:MAG: 50S ribosomal protein L19 [Candidatus Moranbacteria bacterium GW2011_GWF2_35_39]OGI31852.1 MAG: 50S ribosomal protein L19 [Candidatus Moranbacteria bacterium RIFOXYB12_FULL_35_8]OGI33374.1 MAG: 50S ribosomal protein L19 [Candidatus Moranbacteria bacterium RIFOXYC12_FULL_36_13]OGI36276.1 MAG: 50S ribosomal protein L19 [Candidatus Moranbacteria bacterium RIFOXYA12_FULL_35_19]